MRWIYGKYFHGDMISHMGIYAKAANTATWITVVAGDDGQGDFQGFFFFTYIPQSPPLPPFLICLFLILGFGSESRSKAALEEDGIAFHESGQGPPPSSQTPKHISTHRLKSFRGRSRRMDCKAIYLIDWIGI